MKIKSKKIFIFLIPGVVFAQVCTAQILKTMRRLPDTGQIQSFTTTPGEDADYTQNPPYFQLHGNGTVTDVVTGLMWQQTDGGEMTYEAAKSYCENLSLAGYTDWRLPTAREAFSMLNQGKSNPAIDIEIFTNTIAEYWWTSDQDVTNTTKIWVTNRGGGIGNHPKGETSSAGGTKKIHVRAVRDQQIPPTVASHFTDNGDGTVTDVLTNLIWQKTPVSDSMSWENALVFSENLTLAGSDDWRLPNIKELQSLCETSIANPAINTSFFPKIGIKKYWASTSLPNQTSRAWYLDTQYGITTYFEKTGKLNLICVRGGQHDIVKTTDSRTENTTTLAFPNPFHDHIFLKNAPQNAVYTMMNAVGQMVFYGKNIDAVDFSHLPAGVYLLTIKGENTAVLRLQRI